MGTIGRCLGVPEVRPTPPALFLSLPDPHAQTPFQGHLENLRTSMGVRAGTSKGNLGVTGLPPASKNVE